MVHVRHVASIGSSQWMVVPFTFLPPSFRRHTLQVPGRLVEPARTFRDGLSYQQDELCTVTHHPSRGATVITKRPHTDTLVSISVKAARDWFGPERGCQGEDSLL